MINPAISGLTARDKTEIWIRTLVRQMTRGKIKFYFKSTPQYAIKNVKLTDDTRLEGAVWLADPRSEVGPFPREITPDEMAERMARVDEAEAHGFGRGWLDASFWPEHRRLLVRALAGLPCLLVAGRSLPPTVATIPDLLSRLKG